MISINFPRIFRETRIGMVMIRRSLIMYECIYRTKYIFDLSGEKTKAKKEKVFVGLNKEGLMFYRCSRIIKHITKIIYWIRCYVRKHNNQA